MQPTQFTVIGTDGTEQTLAVPLPEYPTYLQLEAVIAPILGERNYFERVAVLHDNQRTDMFVDENGAIKGLPSNERATAIYRHNALVRYPHTDPESLPAIYGTAVLFSRPVC